MHYVHVLDVLSMIAEPLGKAGNLDAGLTMRLYVHTISTITPRISEAVCISMYALVYIHIMYMTYLSE